MDKNLIFEYFVFRLDEWKKCLERNGVYVPVFTKLRLQKVLFLVCAWNTTNCEKKLLNIFNNFCALPYGPVEMDVYEAMRTNNVFQHISFHGNECVYTKLEESMFKRTDCKEFKWIDEAVNKFKKEQRSYLFMPVFDLVELTHKWSVWKISMDIATTLGHKKEEMSVECICNSSIKAY